MIKVLAVIGALTCFYWLLKIVANILVTLTLEDEIEDYEKLDGK